MNDCSIPGSEGHLTALIKWLYEEALSAGGDGDAAWLTKYYRISDLFTLVEAFNNSLGDKKFWTVHMQGDSIIHWTHLEEGIYITSDEKFFNNLPDWYQVKIRY